MDSFMDNQTHDNTTIQMGGCMDNQQSGWMESQQANCIVLNDICLFLVVSFENSNLCEMKF